MGLAIAFFASVMRQFRCLVGAGHRVLFWHFEAANPAWEHTLGWTEEEIAWVDDHLKFNGRIVREEWTRQAKLLAEGKEEEFHKLYGTGGLQNKKGETESGTRTRKE